MLSSIILPSGVGWGSAKDTPRTLEAEARRTAGRGL